MNDKESRSTSKKLKVYISFLGAAGEIVTGSCSLLSIYYDNKLVSNNLVDCGMFQEENEYPNHETKIKGIDIDNIFITHVHSDHIGTLPCRRDLKGRVYICAELIPQARDILLDSATNNEKQSTYSTTSLDALKRQIERCRRKDVKKNRDNSHIISWDSAYESVKDMEGESYSKEDVNNILKKFIAVTINQEYEVNDVITVRYIPNSHIYGACSIKFTISMGGEKVTVVFSGDVGPTNSFLYNTMGYEKNYEMKNIILEGIHGATEAPESWMESKRTLKRLITDGGYNTIVISTFALERSAVIIAILNELLDECPLDVYIDSRLTCKLMKHYERAYVRKNTFWFKDFNGNIFDLSRFKKISGDFERQKIAGRNRKIILATSCMGYYGSIRFWFDRHIQNPNTLFVFPGYLSENSPSERLNNTMYGENILIGSNLYTKYCQTIRMDGFSGHGYFRDKTAFLDKYPSASTIILNHARMCEKKQLREKIKEMYPDIKVYIPQISDVYCITEDGLYEVDKLESIYN